MTNNHTRKESNHPNLLKNKNNIPKREEAMLLLGVSNGWVWGGHN